MKNVSENKIISSVEEIVNSAFKKITQIGILDKEMGNKPINESIENNTLMSDIPNKMTEFIEKNNGLGCCFIFSAYIMKILNEHDINNFMIITTEKDLEDKDKMDSRASVMYEDNGQFYIANPAEDIEYFTQHEIKKEDRVKYYEEDKTTTSINGERHNAARYTINEFYEKCYLSPTTKNEFKDEEKNVWLLGSMSKDSTKTLSEAMGEVEVIMSSKEKTPKVKNLLKEQIIKNAKKYSL